MDESGMDCTRVFGTATPVIGMVHLPALPGAPQYEGSRAAIRERARADAAALEAGGVDGIMVENFGDVPFYPDDVPKHVVASMTSAVETVCRTVDCPVGVNVLRNDAAAAVSIAAATDAEFVRVNVHTGARVTDQGVLEGQAHETIRLRDDLDADVRVLADVDVKHSAPLASEPFGSEAFADAEERGLADGTIVSGVGTGHAIDIEELERVTTQRAERDLTTPLFVGSGVTPENVADILSIADGVIVGTALKEDRETTAPVQQTAVEELMAAVEAID